MKKVSFRFKLKNKLFNINVKECISLWSKFSGLMFKNKSPCLLFVFNKNKNLCIHSFFCKPFIAIWFNSDKEITKILNISEKGINFCGFGKYLLEIPQSDENYLKMTKILKLSDGDNAKV